jgi:hypothetical protein
MSISGKHIVSTALDVCYLEQLDRFCELVHRTRAEVIRGLLYSLITDKQDIYAEWRAVWVKGTPIKSVEQLAHTVTDTGSVRADTVLCEKRVLKVIKAEPKPLRYTQVAALLDGAMSRTSIFGALQRLAARGEIKQQEVHRPGERRHTVYWIEGA